MTSTSKSTLVTRRLYRALLRAVKPFTPPQKDYAILSCLLHRSFVPMEVDEKLARRHRDGDYAMTDPFDEMYPEVEEEPYSSPRDDPHFLLFRRLMWTVFSEGHSYSASSSSSQKEPCYQIPNHINDQPHKLRDIIRQEFRVPDTQVGELDYILDAPPHIQPTGYLSAVFSIKARRDAAFLALRKLNEKLAWSDQLEEVQRLSQLSPTQSAKHIEPMWKAMAAINGSKDSLSSHLTPGTFLVAHPHLSGFFRKAVICILQHGAAEENDDKTKTEGTYGLIINRPSISEATGRNRTLASSLNFSLPNEISQSLGGAPMKDGGPVNMPTIQMMHGGDNDNDEQRIGGSKIPLVTGLDDEKVVRYQGDIMKAAQAVASGKIDRDDVTFFVGASCWYPGQLEKEIRQGCWLLCRGPPEMALSGACEHRRTEEGEPRPKADLWLSLMSAFGEEEAKLAHLMAPANEDDEYAAACDDIF